MFRVMALICVDRLHFLKGNRLRRSLNGFNRSPDQKSWKDVSEPSWTEVPLSSTFKDSKEHHIDLLLSLDRHAVTLASDSQTTATLSPQRGCTTLPDVPPPSIPKELRFHHITT